MTKHFGFILIFFYVLVAGTNFVFAQLTPALKPLSGSKVEKQVNKGVELFTRGQWQAAQKHFQSAVDADPRSPEAHYNLALTLDKMGDRQKAKKHFEQAASLGRYNPFIRNSKILKKRMGPQH